jgi:hypothetical protein
MRRFEKDMDDYYDIRYIHIGNGQSAAKIVSDNNTVQRLEKVRYFNNYQKSPRMPVLDLKN